MKEFLKIFNKNRILQFTQKYSRYITPSALLLGFIIDNIILQRVDTLFTFFVMFYHFSIITIGILILHSSNKAASAHDKYVQLVRTAIGIIIPFSFGALFSGFFIFYSQSAGSLVSWIFLLILMLFMISTEYYKKYYLNTIVQITLWYFTLLSFLILYVPIAIKQLNAGVFMLSGLLSIFIAFGFFYILSILEPTHYAKYAAHISRNTVLVFVLINVLYFTNIIPPIPLALQHGDAYYSVVRNDNSYLLTTEDHPWYALAKYTTTTIHRAPGSPVSVFSAVFAPERLSPKLYHQWQYRDDNNKWITASTISFPIVGGRDAGYRGYTTKWNLWPGAWRVRIITQQKQVVGTVRFNIKSATITPALIQEVR